MVQDQLVDYVGSQLKLGVSREAVKAALVGAGWVPGDVEDTLKKVEGPAKPASVISGVAPVSISTGPAMAKPAMSVSSASTVSTSVKPGDSIRVSDLVSGTTTTVSPSTMGKSTTVTTSTAAVKPAATMTAAKNSPIDLAKVGVIKGNTFEAHPGTVIATRKSGGWLLPTIFGVLFLLAAGFAGYLYTENSSLASKVDSVSTTSGSLTTQLASLNTQMTALDASNTTLAAQVATLAAENSDLMTNLSFSATAPSSTAPETVSIVGALEQTKTGFTLTTGYGVVVLVQNAKDAAVSKALLAVVTSTNPVTLTGTHTPGTEFISVTNVNGAPTQ